MKKILSAILALSMILCMGIFANAAAEPTPTPFPDVVNAQDAANWTLGNGWAATNDEAGNITLTNTNANGMAVYNGETAEGASWTVKFDITRTDAAKAVNTVKFSVGTVTFFIRIKLEDAATSATLEWMNEGDAAWTKAGEGTLAHKAEAALNVVITRPGMGNAIIVNMVDETTHEILLAAKVYDTVETIGAGAFSAPMSGLTIGGEEGVGVWTLTDIGIHQYAAATTTLPDAGEYSLDNFGALTHEETTVFSKDSTSSKFDFTGEFEMSYELQFPTEAGDYIYLGRVNPRPDKDTHLRLYVKFNPESWTWGIEHRFYFAGWCGEGTQTGIEGAEGVSTVTVTLNKCDPDPNVEGDTKHFYITLSQGSTILFFKDIYEKDMDTFFFSAKSTEGHFTHGYEERGDICTYTFTDLYYVAGSVPAKIIPPQPEPTPIPTPDITLPGQEGNTTTKAPVTQAPATTQAPAGADDEEGGANIGLIIGIVAAVVVVVAVVVVIVIKKKK